MAQYGIHEVKLSNIYAIVFVHTEPIIYKMIVPNVIHMVTNNYLRSYEYILHNISLIMT